MARVEDFGGPAGFPRRYGAGPWGTNGEINDVCRGSDRISVEVTPRGLSATTHGVASSDASISYSGCERHKRMGVSLAFPHDKYPPSRGHKFAHLLFVPSSVRGEFLLPESRVRRRQACVVAAPMSVPETAVNKDYRAESGQYQIRFSGQVPAMKAVAQACAVQRPTHGNLGLSIFSFDCSHICAARGGTLDVHSATRAER